MKLSAAKARREEIGARKVQIEAQLAAMRHAYFQDGIEGVMSVRTGLETERANLAVEQYALDQFLSATKAAQKQYRAVLSHAVLIRLLTERGLGQIVVEADRIAMDQCVAEDAQKEHAT